MRQLFCCRPLSRDSGRQQLRQRCCCGSLSPAVCRSHMGVCGHPDSDRAVVECFFGRLKRRFTILGDEGFRLEPGRDDRLEDVVSLCIALTNLRHRSRGYALSFPPLGFVRHVPHPMTSFEILQSGGVVPALNPPIHPSDPLTGLHPDTAMVLARDPTHVWPRRIRPRRATRRANQRPG